MEPGDKKYLAFSVTALILLGLLGLGALAYKPLRLRYAIYKVRQTGGFSVGSTQDPFSGITSDIKIADKWLMCVVETACQGNRQAMEIAVERAGILSLSPDFIVGLDISYVLAMDQPELFFEVLEGHVDKQVIDVLVALKSAARKLEGRSFFIGFNTPGDLWYAFKLQASRAEKTEVRRVAKATEKFIRQRFPEEAAKVEAEIRERDGN